MSTSRKIQIALGAILLWSSASVSSFAATNTINPEKFQSDTVKLPVESMPSSQLNRTQYAQLRADPTSARALFDRVVSDANNIWQNPADRRQKLLDYCNTPPENLDVNRCLKHLNSWVMLRSYQIEPQLSDQDKQELMALENDLQALIVKNSSAGESSFYEECVKLNEDPDIRSALNGTSQWNTMQCLEQ